MTGLEKDKTFSFFYFSTKYLHCADSKIYIKNRASINYLPTLSLKKNIHSTIYKLIKSLRAIYPCLLTVLLSAQLYRHRKMH